MAKRVIDDGTLTSIADRIRECAPSLEGTTFTPTEMPEKIGKVFDTGKQTQYDEFWDRFQSNGSRQQYDHAFKGSYWDDNTFKPKYDIIVSNSAEKMFYGNSCITDLRDIGVKMNFGNCTDLTQAFAACDALLYIGDISAAKVTSCTAMCSLSQPLREIGVFTVGEATTFGNCFFGCRALEKVTFAGTIGNSLKMHYCPLNRESIESIIECLSKTASGQSLTLNQAAKEAAFTGEEWATLIADKANWTISLS